MQIRKIYPTFQLNERLQRVSLDRLARSQVNYGLSVLLQFRTANKDYLLFQDENKQQVKVQPLKHFTDKQLCAGSRVLFFQPQVKKEREIIVLTIKFEQDFEVLPKKIGKEYIRRLVNNKQYRRALNLLHEFKDKSPQVYHRDVAEAMAQIRNEESACCYLQQHFYELKSQQLDFLFKCYISSGYQKDAQKLLERLPNRQDLKNSLLRLLLHSHGVYDLKEMVRNVLTGKQTQFMPFYNPKIQYITGLWMSNHQIGDSQLLIMQQALCMAQQEHLLQQSLMIKLFEKPGFIHNVIRIMKMIQGQTQIYSTPKFCSFVKDMKIRFYNLQFLLLKRRNYYFFPYVHMFRHSCEPNCQFVCLGNYIIFKTNKKIQPKQELTLDFMRLINPSDKKQVQRTLKHSCKCYNCSQLKFQKLFKNTNLQIRQSIQKNLRLSQHLKEKQNLFYELIQIQNYQGEALKNSLKAIGKKNGSYKLLREIFEIIIQFI